MAATKSRSRSNTKSVSHNGKSSRCWKGYEPTPGKKPGAKWSCKPKK